MLRQACDAFCEDVVARVVSANPHVSLIQPRWAWHSSCISINTIFFACLLLLFFLLLCKMACAHLQHDEMHGYTLVAVRYSQHVKDSTAHVHDAMTKAASRHSSLVVIGPAL
jgi:hypothetical protein